jgi:hypothetical protein
VIILKVKTEVLAIVLAVVILVSTLFASLPLVHADYRVDHASFPPDLPGDVNYDGKVDIKDISLVGKACPSSFATGGSWNPRCDVNDDGKVDIRDVSAVAKLFGRPWYNTSATPIAYSTSFEFDVPNTGVSGVWYYILARVYMPSGLLSNLCFLQGSSDSGLQNVIIDTLLKCPDQAGGPFSITLGNLAQGYHLLELECLGPASGGSINFTVQTSAGEAAWLDRFRICVPNCSSSMIEYGVKINTYFPYDTYYLGGNASKYIRNIWVDSTGQVWPDWEWNIGSFGSILGWGDGFMYPLDQSPTILGMHSVSFTYGNNESGLLDFQYVSQSNQSAKIGLPKFFASASMDNIGVGDWWDGSLPLGSPLLLLNQGVSGGSQWATFPGISVRNTTFQAEYGVSWSCPPWWWFNGTVDMAIGNWYATWALGGSNPPDMGIPLNFTVANVTSGIIGGGNFWRVFLSNYSIDTYSFTNLQLGNMENGQWQSNSFISPSWTMLLNYAGTAILALGPFIPGVGGLEIGTLVGLGISGTAVAFDYAKGQRVSNYNITVQQNNHLQLYAKPDPWWTQLFVEIDNNNTSGSAGDLIFLGLKPQSGKSCGLTEIVFTGLLKILCGVGSGFTVPIGTIHLTLCIPWFIWP